MSHDHPDRSGRPRQGDDSTPLSGLETESSEYEIVRLSWRRITPCSDCGTRWTRNVMSFVATSSIASRTGEGEPGLGKTSRVEQCRPTLGNLEKPRRGLHQ